MLRPSTRKRFLFVVAILWLLGVALPLFWYWGGWRLFHPYADVPILLRIRYVPGVEMQYRSKAESKIGYGFADDFVRFTERPRLIEGPNSTQILAECSVYIYTVPHLTNTGMKLVAFLYDLKQRLNGDSFTCCFAKVCRIDGDNRPVRRTQASMGHFRKVFLDNWGEMERPVLFREPAFKLKLGEERTITGTHAERNDRWTERRTWKVEQVSKMDGDLRARLRITRVRIPLGSPPGTDDDILRQEDEVLFDVDRALVLEDRCTRVRREKSLYAESLMRFVRLRELTEEENRALSERLHALDQVLNLVESGEVEQASHALKDLVERERLPKWRAAMSDMLKSMANVTMEVEGERRRKERRKEADKEGKDPIR